jgi:hypothetical protein
MRNTLLLLILIAVNSEAFLKAVAARDLATVQTMLAEDAAVVDARSAKGNSAVTAALFINKGEGFVDARSNEVLKALLDAHPKLDLFDTAAVGTSMQLAAMLKSDSGAVMKRSPFGWTPLHLAAFAGNVDNVELLLAKGAAVNDRARSKFLNTPLQTALLSGQFATAKILLDHGADPLVRQAHGFTPMHEAAELGRQDIVQLLLDHGAELNSVSDSGKTPLSEALRGKHAELAEWMKSRGAAVEPTVDVE